MSSLFNDKDNQQIIQRINRLSETVPAQWGKLNATLMLAHVQQPFHVGYGQLKLKRGLIGILFGRMAKKQLLSGKPFKKNLPTVKEFLISDPGSFEIEKNKLINLIVKFKSDGPEALTTLPHPFFGKMDTNEWDLLLWKHLDHHLNQFGV